MSLPLMIERGRFPPDNTLGFHLYGKDREHIAAFWDVTSAYVDAEMVVELAMLEGSQNDLSEQLAVIRRSAALLEDFGLSADDVAYILICLQGISQRRTYVWTFLGSEATPDDVADFRPGRASG